MAFKAFFATVVQAVVIIIAMTGSAHAALYQIDFSGSVYFETGNEFDIGDTINATVILNSDDYYTTDSNITTQVYYGHALVSYSLNSVEHGYALSGSLASGVAPNLVVRNDWYIDSNGYYLDGYYFDLLHQNDNQSSFSTNLGNGDHAYNASILMFAGDTSPVNLVNGLDIPTSLNLADFNYQYFGTWDYQIDGQDQRMKWEVESITMSQLNANGVPLAGTVYLFGLFPAARFGWQRFAPTGGKLSQR